ncbi:MAG: hypothetical protein AAF361_13050, partial [Bacteroidota bacterium]
MFKKIVISCACIMALNSIVLAQQSESSLPYSKIFAYGMDANVSPALSLLEDKDLTAKDLQFKKDFEARFKGPEDTGNVPGSDHPEMAELLAIFRDYWRKSLLDIHNSYEKELGGKVIPYLMKHYPPIRDKQVSRDSLGYYLSGYIHSKDLFTTEKVDFQGRLLDLCIWQDQLRKTYDVRLSKNEIQAVPVFFLKDFITLGWMEYATLGRHYPGGWATEEALYCVEKGYDLESENFLVSFLAHEGRHFSDKNFWPELKSADLEYRAKLTELSLAEKTSSSLIHFFIENANKDSKNSHQIANYCLIRDLSLKLFDVPFEKDVDKWDKMGWEK